MALRDLNDAWGWVQKIIRRIERLESGAMLENSSITDGRMRFIGGLLRVDSGGRVEIEGTLEGGGTFIWTGTLTNNGPLIQNGTWKLNGTGEIVGNTLLTGNLTVQGGGKITAGSVRIEGGKIYVGTMVLDPTNHNGMITFPNDGQVLATGNNLEMYGPNGAGGRNGIRILPDHISIAKLPTRTDLSGLFWVAADNGGNLYKVAQNVGGPMRPLRWPFPSSTVTDEFGPRPSPGPGGSTDHEGIDFAPGAGTAIPAAGSGTVELAGDNGGFGYCVIINHGGGLKTLYGHMQSMPSVSVGSAVTAGQTIGYVGNTGVSFGAHLHFEVHVNGTPVNPRNKLPAS